MLGLASQGHETCRMLSRPSVDITQKKSLYQIEEGPIRQGDGEYIAFHVRGKQTEAPSQDTFARVYAVFNTYAPHAILNRETPSLAMEQCLNRHAIIQAKVKEIDPTLEIAFIPRTLYELYFLKKCSKEELNNPTICDLSLSFIPSNSKTQKRNLTLADKRVKNKCWHICHFRDAGDNTHPQVQEIAYRLNRSMIKHFAPSPTGFTYRELATLTEKEIAFYHFFLDSAKKLASRGEGSFSFTRWGFKTKSKIFHLINTSVTSESAQIIHDAVALNCSKAATNHFFLYRGSLFQQDDYYARDWKWMRIIHNLSYGSSLFAGSIYDDGAAPFFFATKPALDIYVISVPYDQLQVAPFYIPPTNSIAQLSGYGELFHGRSKFWKGAKTKGVTGIAKTELPATHYSELSQEEVLSQFKHYKANAIHLKHARCVRTSKL